MQDSINHMKIFTAMFSLFFVGCAAAILSLYRAAKNFERPLSDVQEERDGDICV